jgi:hypothetical protein
MAVAMSLVKVAAELGLMVKQGTAIAQCKKVGLLAQGVGAEVPYLALSAAELGWPNSTA